MGKGAARHVVTLGGTALICSRSEEKLSKAKYEIMAGIPETSSGSVRTQSLDNTNEEAVKAFFSGFEAGSIDGIIITALGRAVHGSFLELETASVKELFEGKLWGPWYCAKYGASCIKVKNSLKKPPKSE